MLLASFSGRSLEYEKASPLQEPGNGHVLKKNVSKQVLNEKNGCEERGDELSL